MYKLVVFICVVLIGLSGCDDREQDVSQIFDVVLTERGSNLKVISLTSDAYNFYQKQIEISVQLSDLVNSGLYDIVSVQTFYSDTYLTAAQVTYNEGVAGEGNKIKLALLVSNRLSFEEKQSRVKPLFDEVLNDPHHEIILSAPLYDDGYLVAAEVYYKDQ